MTRLTLSGKAASRVVRRLSLLVFVLTLGFPGVASALLVDRGPNLVYDTVLDITWVRDAHLCVSLGNCISPDNTRVQGGMTWVNANTWASNLVYAGFDDWRLPYASVAAGVGPAGGAAVHSCPGAANAGGADEVSCRDNEMAYMFYYNLDGHFGENKTGDQTAVGGEMLTDIQLLYWTATEFATESVSDAAWFVLLDGRWSQAPQEFAFAAWAVRAGDVGAAAVPEPGSLWLLGFGALTLALSRRRERWR